MAAWPRACIDDDGGGGAPATSAADRDDEHEHDVSEMEVGLMVVLVGSVGARNNGNGSSSDELRAHPWWPRRNTESERARRVIGDGDGAPMLSSSAAGYRGAWRREDTRLPCMPDTPRARGGH